MLLKIVYLLAILLEFVFVPLFLKYSWPKKCKKSLGFKMICSCLFITAAVCCALYSHNTSVYAKLLFGGLVFGVLGDLFLHIPSAKFIYAGIGGVAFWAGHIFFILAFQKGVKLYDSSKNLVDLYTVIPVVCALLIMIAYKFIKKVKVGALGFAMLAYAATITTMLVTGIRFAFAVNSLPVYLTVLLGSALFITSDSSLALFSFGGFSHSKGLKNFYIITYFTAQILLGTSILFIGV